jgi:type I restriction enzyme M protein
MSQKRDVLEQLKRDELVAAADRLDLELQDRRAKGPLVEALAGSRKAGIPAILEDLARDRLKEICRALGLDDSGKEKAVIIARIAGEVPAAPPSPAPARVVPPRSPAPTPLTLRIPTDSPIKKSSQGNRLPVFERAFKNIDDVLRKEAGCTTELDYTEQTSWLLFLKYLEGLEEERAMEAQLEGKKYTFILDEPYRWERWAAPKGKDGQIDHNKAQTGDDLRDFVNGKLFPYLHGFKQKASGPNTIEYKIGEIFGEIKNKIQSGYNLREIIDHIDELRFRSQTEKHELSHLYEAKIRNMGNAGRNGGEYYTPRPLIRAMVQVVQPRIGDRIYDGACGSAGFLCESFEYLKAGENLTTKDLKTLQESTFVGKEKKSLAYVIAIMNMILHGIEAPTIIHTNTLTENLADIQEKDRFEVILANPPFGGNERKEVQENFSIRTGETAYLFLQHFIKMLRAGGRAGVVIKNTFLSNTDNASVSLRKQLLETCNLHTVLDCPGGTFQGAGVKTVVLFFEKGAPTRKVWYYQLDPSRNLGKTNPLNDDDLAEFVRLQKTFADSPKSWSVDAKSLDKTTFDLSVKNPNGGEKITHRSPQDIMAEIVALDAESAKVLHAIRDLL